MENSFTDWMTYLDIFSRIVHRELSVWAACLQRAIHPSVLLSIPQGELPRGSKNLYITLKLEEYKLVKYRIRLCFKSM